MVEVQVRFLNRVVFCYVERQLQIVKVANFKRSYSQPPQNRWNPNRDNAGYRFPQRRDRDDQHYNAGRKDQSHFKRNDDNPDDSLAKEVNTSNRRSSN